MNKTSMIAALVVLTGALACGRGNERPSETGTTSPAGTIGNTSTGASGIMGNPTGTTGASVDGGSNGAANTGSMNTGGTGSGTSASGTGAGGSNLPSGTMGARDAGSSR